jgi:ankyrin repeat protein
VAAVGFNCEHVRFVRVGGDTVLHWAAQQNHTEMAALLLQHGAGADEQNKCVPRLYKKHKYREFLHRAGSTPLHFAVSKNHVEMAVLLLNHGAQINSKNEWVFACCSNVAAISPARTGRA